MSEGVLQDVRHALRLIRKSPGFAVVAALSLGVGVGANTAIFSVVNALFFVPLPIAEPERAVAVYTSDSGGARYGGSSLPDFQDLRDQPGLFASLAAYTFEPVALGTDREPVRVWSEFVSGDYFATLGLKMALGRPLDPGDDVLNAAPALVISHGLWQRRLGGSAAALGGPLTLSGTTFTVVGVAPAGFSGLQRSVVAEAWVPLALRPRLVPGSEGSPGRGTRFLSLVGRLAPGLGLSEAAARLEVVAAQLHAAHRDQWSDVKGQARRLSLLPEDQARIAPAAQGRLKAFAALLGLVVGAVLLIACANVANLMLARLSARRREIAVRLSLGAGRARLVRQFLTESVLVAALGGAVGVVLAWWTSGALTGFRPDLPVPVPMQLDVHVDGRVLAFAVGLSLLTGVLLGLAPALQATRPDLVAALKDEGFGVASGRQGRRLRRGFVAIQVALSVVLLVGAGLLVRGLQRASSLGPGFDPRGVELLPVDLGLAGYDAPQAADLIDRVAERAPALPGVRAAALAVTLPLDLHNSRRRTLVEGYTPQPGEDMEFYFGVVGPGYFEALGIPVLRGRSFSTADRAEAPGVAVVNETFARRFWAGQDPIGKTLQVRGESGPRLTVVGVVRDSKYISLAEEPRPYYYLPLLQDFGYVRRFARFFPTNFVVGTSGDAAGASRALAAAVTEADPRLPIYPAKSIDGQLGFSVLPARVASGLFGAFGVLGLGLAGLGLYGVVAYAAAQRTKEIGVRIALGASGADILRLVVGDGLRVVAAGLAAGALLAAALGQALRSLLYGVSPLDPVTFAAVPVLLAAVALVASLLPARRAARVDPAVALRCE